MVPNLTVIDIAPDARVYNARPIGKDGKIAGMLLHSTGGRNSLAWLSTYHANPVSIHKLVPKHMPDGNAGHYQIVADHMRAWHAGDSLWGGRADWNDFSIGVEIENLGDGMDPYTDEQYETVAQIVAYNCALYRIGDDWVRDHREVAMPPGRKTDPVGWDHERMWRRVLAVRTEWPQGWPAFWCCMERIG